MDHRYWDVAWYSRPVYDLTFRDLGRNWSIKLELHEEQALITDGVCNHIRHPMYVGLFALFAAQAFLIRNWIMGPLGVVCFVANYLGRVSEEERMMSDLFGEEYEQFKSRTGRVFPKMAYGS